MTTKRNEKRMNLIIVGLVIWMLLAAMFQFPTSVVRADTPEWMSQGNYFIHEVVTNYTSPVFYNETVRVNITIEEVTSTNVTIWENWYDPSNESNYIEGGGTFNLTTRQAEGHAGYHSWFWINDEDLENGTVYIADKTTHLKDITPLHFVLNYSEPSGNESTLYYGRESYRFESCVGHAVEALDTESDFANSFVSSGRGVGGRNTRTDARESNLEDSDFPGSEPGNGILQFYSFEPPYYSSWYGWWKVRDRGLGTCLGDAYAGHISGTLENYGHVGSGGGGEKWMKAYAEIHGPEDGSFQVSETAYYDIWFFHKVNGEARTWASWGTPHGAGRVWGKIYSYGVLYKFTGGYQNWYTKKTIYSADTCSAIWCWPRWISQSWDNHYVYYKISNARLYSSYTYHFYSNLITQHYVWSFGTWAGTSWSILDSDFFLVSVMKR
ncbi:MAG: hypothetical protein ACE5IO_01970 [Thermoplasmata archaeon]